MSNKWWEYVQSVSHKARPADIAERTKISAPTISRWNPENKGGPARPDPDNVVRFAREYGRSPLEALIIADYIEADDIGKPVQLPGSAKDMSDASLVEALADRLARYSRIAGNDSQDGLVPEDWGEDPGMDGMQNRN